MASVLHALGYGPVESLETFLLRFTSHVPKAELDNDLANVWVCHRNIQNVLKLQIMLHNNSHIQHLSFKNSFAVDKGCTQNQFCPKMIFQKINTTLTCCLANYILNECLVLYNWGISSFEIVFDNEEFSYRILKYEMMCEKKGKLINMSSDFKKWRKLLTGGHGNITKPGKRIRRNSCDLFEEEEVKLGHMKRRKTTVNASALRRIYSSCSRPIVDIYKSMKELHQEMFNIDKILYNTYEKGWPKSHALSADTPDEMLRRILRRLRNVERDFLMYHSERWITLRNILSFMLRNHKAIAANNGYGRILKHHLKDYGFLTGSPSRKLKPISVSVVSSYVADILRKVVPLEFYGSNRLRKKFFREVTNVINGGRSENFIFQRFMEAFVDFKSELRWICEIEGWGIARRVISAILKWLLLDYVFLILKNQFYITDVGSSGYRLYYYKKRDVQRAVDLWIKEQLRGNNIQLMEGDLEHLDSIERIWLETGWVKTNGMTVMMPETTEYIYPVAKVRFMPKAETNDELRMITSYPVKKVHLWVGDIRRKQLVNMFIHRYVKRGLMLRKVRLFLEFLVENENGIGFKPFPNSPKLQVAWKRAVRLKQTSGKIYFVKADITNAFGSVLPDLLGAIIEGKLKTYGSGVLQMRCIRECRLKNGGVDFEDRKSFGHRPKENRVLLSRSMMAGSKKLSSYRAGKLKAILDQIIHNQYLRVNGKCYKLTKGLTQGSAGSLSPLLCEIYCNEMDRRHFIEFLMCKECVLLRGVDDYLLITSSIERATKFYDIVYNGIKDFNITFNRSKLKSNIHDDISSVPYLGLVFDFRTMCVKPDYTKSMGRDTMSFVKLNDKFGYSFFRKTRFLLYKSLHISPFKLTSITLNSEHNPSSVVRETVYEASAFCLNRILSLTRHLYRGASRDKNDLDLFVILSKVLGKITNSVTWYNSDLSREEVAWLFWNAASTVSRKYSGAFSDLLVLIRHRIRAVERACERNGKDSIIDCARKETKDGNAWREIRHNIRVLTSNSKPSKRFKC